MIKSNDALLHTINIIIMIAFDKIFKNIVIYSKIICNDFINPYYSWSITTRSKILMITTQHYY